jgi:hypothetical protein
MMFLKKKDKVIFMEGKSKFEKLKKILKIWISILKVLNFNWLKNKIMSSKATTIEIFEKVEDYTQVQLWIGKLKVIDTSADVASSLISRLTVAIVLLCLFF